MLNIAVEMLMETIMAEAEAEKFQEENATNKAAVAARRAATAKKAAKVAAEAAKFEDKKVWQRPEKQEYLFEKAAKHCHKSALMGTRRYNGEYTPYKRGTKILANSIVIEDDYEDNIFEAEDKLTGYYKLVEEKARIQKELESIESSIEFEEMEIKYMKKNYDRIVNPTQWGDDYIIKEIFNGFIESRKPFIEEMKEEAARLRAELLALEEAVFYF